MSQSFRPFARQLRDFAESRPNHDALVFSSPSGTQRYTYKALNDQVDAVAGYFSDCGIGSNSAVIIASPNSAEAVIASSAAWRLGCFVAPISHKSTISDLEATIANMKETGKDVVVLSDHHSGENIDQKLVPLSGLLSLTSKDAVADLDPLPARAIPSGGTTGRPKLIVDRSPWGYDPNRGIQSVLGEFGWHDATSVLVYSPLYHNVGQTLTGLGLASGKKVVLMDRFDAARAQALITSEAIEFFFAVPVHMKRFLALENLDADAFQTVRSMYHAGAACSPELKRAWISLLGPERVWELYGATDGTGFTIIGGEEWLEHPGSVGKPCRSEIKILDDHLSQSPSGEIGRIFMKAEGASADQPEFAYLGAQMPEVTEDGFRTVGDMGYFDDEGYLFIADRRTDMIISGGANVFPAEVEAALCRHPAISEAAVIGITDPEWGRRVHAIIVLDPNVEPPGDKLIKDFMSQQIVSYKIPKTIEYRTELAYTDVDKLDRKFLTENHELNRIPDAAGRV